MVVVKQLLAVLVLVHVATMNEGPLFGQLARLRPISGSQIPPRFLPSLEQQRMDGTAQANSVLP